MSDNPWDYNNQDNSGSLWPTLTSTGDAFNFGQSTNNAPAYPEAVRIYGEAKANALYEGIASRDEPAQTEKKGWFW